MGQSTEEFVADVVARARAYVGAVPAGAAVPPETAELLRHCQAVVDYADGRAPLMPVEEFAGHLEAVVRISGESVRRILGRVGKVFDDVQQRRDLEQLRAAFGGEGAQGRA